ncbi:ABC transporter ATP-binding protein [Acidothermaceae bacterium B102]|nr:ABC transporter ATP-binding protein [Acidothermaceae bacterium B102]
MQGDHVDEAGYLRIEGLTAGYGATTILRNVSISVSKGEIVAVIGPNGAGKSTLLKAITGALTVTGGTVTAGDRNITAMKTHEIARAGVGYVPQTRHIFPRLSVRENLEMGGYSLPKKEVGPRVDEVLEGFPGIAALQSRSAGNLSGGEAKMLAIARVLMTRPSVLLLDEPTADLAPRIAGRFLEEQVAGLASQGVAALVVEQRAREILGVASWAYLMRAGQVDLSQAAGEMRARDDIAQIFLGGR